MPAFLTLSGEFKGRSSRTKQAIIMLMAVGWNDYRREHGCIVHVDIIDGKFWIQRDGTEDGIAGELEAAGVPKEHIVLAFKSPEIRKHTGYAVA